MNSLARVGGWKDFGCRESGGVMVREIHGLVLECIDVPTAPYRQTPSGLDPHA